MARFGTATAETLAAPPPAKERVLGVEVVKRGGDDFVEYSIHFGVLHKPRESENGLLPPTAWWLRHLPQPVTISLGDCPSPW